MVKDTAHKAHRSQRYSGLVSSLDYILDFGFWLADLLVDWKILFEKKKQNILKN